MKILGIFDRNISSVVVELFSINWEFNKLEKLLAETDKNEIYIY